MALAVPVSKHVKRSGSWRDDNTQPSRRRIVPFGVPLTSSPPPRQREQPPPNQRMQPTSATRRVQSTATLRWRAAERRFVQGGQVACSWCAIREAHPRLASVVAMDPQGIRLLYAYNRWANARTLAAVTGLTAEQLTRDLGTSHRSVFGTLAHILWSEWRWLGRWLAPAPAPGPDPLVCEDLAGLQARWRELERAQQTFVDRVTDAGLVRPITDETPLGTPWTYPLEQMLQHVVNHSTYHRGQVTTLVRQLGAMPVPTDFLVFIDEGGSVAGAAPARGGGRLASACSRQARPSVAPLGRKVPMATVVGGAGAGGGGREDLAVYCQ